MKSLQERLKSIGVNGELPKLTKATEALIDELVSKAEAKVVDVSEESKEQGPTPQDENWQEYVLGQLREDEVVTNEKGEKRPRINGLRRLTEKLIGPVISSMSKVVKSPSPDSLSATVEHTITIRRKGVKSFSLFDSNCITITDVADVSPLNTDDDFVRFSASVAATRAEARCYRKALYLYNTPAEEEMTNKTASSVGMDWKPDDMISSAQVNGIDVLCKRLNINVEAFLKMGETEYASVTLIPKTVASKMLSYLNSLQQGKTIPEEIKGYKEGWKK